MHALSRWWEIECRPREAAHVMPGVEEAREGEADAHRDVVLECVPRRVVVAAPRLRGIALCTKATRASDHEGALVGKCCKQALSRSARHQQRLHRTPQQANRLQCSLVAAQSVVIIDLVLVVVVPHCVGAELDEG